MKIKKILSVLLTLCLFVNVSFAFDPYADEEVEKKSYKKLYYGIALTLLGGFLAYDGFSLEKVDVSKPSVDFLTVSHSEWIQSPKASEYSYQIRSGVSLNNVPGTDYNYADFTKYEILKEGKQGYVQDKEPYIEENYDKYSIEPNILYNTGNVDLRNITIEVRYIYNDGTYISDEHGTPVTEEGYHTAGTNSSATTPPKGESGDIIYDYEHIEKLNDLKKEDFLTWQDIFDFDAFGTNQPMGDPRSAHLDNHPGEAEQAGKEFYNDGTAGLNLGKDSAVLMEVRVKLEKNKQYTPIYETRHKSDLEGVAGVFIGIAGIYFIIDHFFDMHKFNAYAKRHHLNLRVTTASNQYKLMLQKRI